MIFAKPWADALIVLIVVLLFFGPKRLPALGKSLGEGMREFKDSITGHSSDDEDERAGLSDGASGEDVGSPPLPGQTATVSTPPAAAPSEPPATATAPPEPARPAAGPEPESAGVASSEQRS